MANRYLWLFISGHAKDKRRGWQIEQSAVAMPSRWRPWDFKRIAARYKKSVRPTATLAREQDTKEFRNTHAYVPLARPLS